MHRLLVQILHLLPFLKFFCAAETEVLQHREMRVTSHKIKQSQREEQEKHHKTLLKEEIVEKLSKETQRKKKLKKS